MSDDRVTCSTCCLRRKSKCMEDDLFVDVNLPRRCVMYKPGPDDMDPRTGKERWPALQKQIERTREEDRLFHRGRK